MTSFI